MPKKTAPKPAKAKSTKPKAKAKMAKPKATPKMKAVAKPEPRREGFMWKLLEQKKNEHKQKEGQSSVNPNAAPEGGFRPNERGPAFSKFQGHRRKVG